DIGTRDLIEPAIAEQRLDVVLDASTIGAQRRRLLVRDAFGKIQVAQLGDRHRITLLLASFQRITAIRDVSEQSLCLNSRLFGRQGRAMPADDQPASPCIAPGADVVLQYVDLDTRRGNLQAKAA